MTELVKLEDELLKVTNEFADSVLSDAVKHLVKIAKGVNTETHKQKLIKLIEECL